MRDSLVGTISAVTEGEYSDYSIRGIFSTRELAQAFVDGRGGDDIQEWGVDEYAGWNKRTHFRCTINRDTGAIIQK